MSAHDAKMALSRLPHVRIELARLYREWRNGKIDNKQLSAGTFALRALASIIESERLDERLAHIEQMLAERQGLTHLEQARLCASAPWAASSIN